MSCKPSILIIDDEPIVRDALRTVLSDCGYEVSLARTGREGINTANSRRFDYTITDFRLPDMTGLDVVRTILQKDPSSLILIITAFHTPEVVAESRRLGAIGVLPKPFFPSEVLDMLINAAATRQLY